MNRKRGMSRAEVASRRGRRPTNPSESQVSYDPITEDNLPDPPSFLGKIGIDLWNDLLLDLVKAGNITKVDVGTLANYCRMWEKFHEAETSINEDGQWIAVGQEGKETLKLNPMINMSLSYSKELRQLAAELGFTPTARKQVTKTPPKQKESKWLKLKK